MSTFDDPFDPRAAPARAGCACGRHSRSQAEHDATRKRRCNGGGRERGRALRRRGRLRGHARGVSAGRRPPRIPEIGRRRDGVRGALAVLPAQDRDRGVRAGGAIEKKDLKVGFIPITCATPIIMAQPMGFYAKHGLNVEVIKTAGWAVIRDKTLNKEYDAAHMLSPMPLAITHGRRLQPDPLHDAGGREHQRPGDHACRSSTRTSAIRRAGRASSSRCRSTTRCTIICCATISPSTASIRTPTSRSAPCRRRKWSPICAPTTSTASSGPIR